MLVVRKEECEYLGFDGERHKIYNKKRDSYESIRQFKMVVNRDEVYVYEADGTVHPSYATLSKG